MDFSDNMATIFNPIVLRKRCGLPRRQMAEYRKTAECAVEIMDEFRQASVLYVLLTSDMYVCYVLQVLQVHRHSISFNLLMSVKMLTAYPSVSHKSILSLYR
jgi:hypothetical protein